MQISIIGNRCLLTDMYQKKENITFVASKYIPKKY